MNAFPAFFPLTGRTVAIAGDGDAAEAKARLFEGSPARLLRLSGAVALDPAAYAGAALAFVAGGDDAFQRGACAAARAAGTPVNVVDRPELCDFTTPAVIDRGEVVAAIGSGGAAPLLVSMLRTDIEASVPEGAGRVAALLRTLQDEVRAALPDLAARRGFLRAALAGPAAAAAMAGDMDTAQRLLRETLAAYGGGRPRGRVSILDHVGPIDLISLRAARRLAQADVLALGDGGLGEIAALARRDARRLTLAGADLVDLAGQGLQVVVAAALDAASVAALRAAGVEVETLASASP